MGIVDGLQAGKYQYITSNNTNNVNIKTGNGNNNINVVGSNVDINTGNGNQNITVNAAGNLNIETGSIGKDIINASAIYASITTNDSDDTIQFIGNSFDISALGGNNTILAKTNMNNSTAQNSINVGNGNDQIIATAKNLSVEDTSGNLTSLVYGDNFKLDAGNGSHTVGFWGNNVSMNLGDGNNSIQTLDFTLASANTNTLGILNDMGVVSALEASTTTSTKVIGEAVKDSTFSYKEAIAKKYNLSNQEKAILDKIDMNATFNDGNPLYVIVRSPKKSAAEGKDVFVIAKRDGTTHTWAESDHECIATDSWKAQTIAGSNVSAKEVTTETTYLLNGISNANIKTGKGDNNIAITSDVNGKSDINIEVGDTKNGNNILVRNGFIVKDIDTKTTTSTTDKSFVVYEYGQRTWNSPLIVDFNKDGQVSAKAGLGVDIDRNGTTDGAATGGDKMLAMSDINGNKNIDGQEVFGDQTVSPFTGEKINSANGFEALKVIAEQAKQYTGVDCIKNGSVDLQSLKTALETVGVKLGFISDNNTTELEDLAHVASINVEQYKEVDTTGDVQHRQQGAYTDTDGNSQKVDDVWFTSQSEKNKANFFDILNKIK